MVSGSDVGLGIEDELLRQSVTDTGSGRDSTRILIRVTDGAAEVEAVVTALVSDNVGLSAREATLPWNTRKVVRGPDNRLWVTYGKVISTRRQICVAYSDDGETWTEEQITTAAAHHYDPCIAVDSAGVVHLAYDLAYTARYRTRTAGVWSAASDLSSNSSYDQDCFAIAIGPDDTLHVGFSESYYSGGWKYITTYRRKVGATWDATELVHESATAAAYNISIAVDDSGVPHLAWEDYGEPGEGAIY